MRLIFIYGPPAVGKTTVGQELANITGYRFFFNHLTVLPAKAIFPDSHEPRHDERYFKLLEKLRLAGLDAAANAGLDVIFTMAYSGSIDDNLVSQIKNLFTSRNGEVHFVELHAPDNILLQRVTNPSRADLHMGKMTEPDHLRSMLEARDMHSSVKYPEVLTIDTSLRTPKEAALSIVENFKLARQS